jgi:hypothetical protein
MTKDIIFNRLLEAYVAEKCAHINDKAKAFQTADDIRFAWRKLYTEAEDGINSQLKYNGNVRF